MEQNQSNDSQVENNTPIKNSDGRRKFLRKASAGALIAAIPAKSVWATGGLTNSIVASGNGSDMSAGSQLRLKSPNHWLHSLSTAEKNIKFKDVFGRRPFNTNNSEQSRNATFFDVLSNDDFKGNHDINLYLVSTYLNAIKHDGYDIVFPVVKSNGMIDARPSFSSDHEFAYKLKSLAMNNRRKLAEELHELHTTGSVARL